MKGERCCTAGGKSSSLCSLGNPVPKDWDADGVEYNWVLFSGLVWFGLGFGFGFAGSGILGRPIGARFSGLVWDGIG